MGFFVWLFFFVFVFFTTAEVVPSGFKSGGSLWGFLKVAGQRFGYCDSQDSVPPECRLSKVFPGSAALFYYLSASTSTVILAGQSYFISVHYIFKSKYRKLESNRFRIIKHPEACFCFPCLGEKWKSYRESSRKEYFLYYTSWYRLYLLERFSATALNKEVLVNIQWNQTM